MSPAKNNGRCPRPSKKYCRPTLANRPTLPVRPWKPSASEIRKLRETRIGSGSSRGNRGRSPEDEFDFIIAGVQFEGRHSVIARSLSVGDRVRIKPEPDNPRDECAVAITLADVRKIGYVPRTDSEDVSACIDDGGYYIATVKKILKGREIPVPVIVLQFYRRDQLDDINDLSPESCRDAQLAKMPSEKVDRETSRPWWQFW